MRSRFLCTAVALASLVGPALGAAAPVCPPEVKEAKELLETKSVVAQRPRTQAAARGQEIQAPRGQETQAPREQETQAPRGQETQAPRGQETQAPRGQETQAPRGQDIQAPRGQETQAPREQDIQAPRNVAKGRTTALSNARRLVNEAEMACKDGDNARATANARAAMELLRYLP